MTLLTNILLAVEEAPAPVDMLKILLALPISRGSKITLLHVTRGVASAEKYTEQLARGRDLLEKTALSLELDDNYRLNTLLRTGDPKEVVSQIAEEMKASLLIMGSRGLNNLMAILKDSVSQYVFQRASCPMLLIRDGVYPNPLNRVAVAVSDSMAAKFALRSAVDLCRTIPGSEILLIHVRTRPLGDQEIGKAIDPEEESLLLATAAEFVRQQRVPYRTLYGVGAAGAEICRIAEENNASFLVLGCEDRRPSIAKTLPDLDLLLGTSVSDYVRIHAPCPVLLQKTPV
ncbi:universal stress protein [Anthocerotibacter panamensis]|uniref:universal stress protein n=1 Tax=Anthocerotibacter panamensis TaxID=2857077 RepID=UPI001C406496|nr:universal stress protein [Anthocerotibacter panamensis]